MKLVQKMLINFSKKLPDIWKNADRVRAMRGKDLPDWDPAVFLPLAGWQALVMNQTGKEVFDLLDIGLMQRLAFLGAWRPGQDIYQFDEDVLKSLTETDLKGNLPAEVLWRLPAWAVYVQAPLESGGDTVRRLYGSSGRRRADRTKRVAPALFEPRS